MTSPAEGRVAVAVGAAEVVARSLAAALPRAQVRTLTIAPVEGDGALCTFVKHAGSEILEIPSS